MKKVLLKPQGLARGVTNYGDAGFSLYLRRSFARSMGYSGEMLSRPVVGIADSRSGFNNCHRHFPELIEAVKRGVLAAGGLPIEFPTVSLGEVFLSPTSMMFRNLMAMDTEEMVRAQAMDAGGLVGGCGKTVPRQLMGAASRAWLAAQPLPIRSVGVKADLRAYEHPVIVDGEAGWDRLIEAAGTIFKSVAGINRCIWSLGPRGARTYRPLAATVTRASTATIPCSSASSGLMSSSAMRGWRCASCETRSRASARASRSLKKQSSSRMTMSTSLSA